jgi:hypothetical protein
MPWPTSADEQACRRAPEGRKPNGWSRGLSRLCGICRRSRSYDTQRPLPSGWLERRPHDFHGNVFPLRIGRKGPYDLGAMGEVVVALQDEAKRELP